MAVEFMLLLALAVRSVAGLGLQGHRWPPNHQLHGTPPKCQGGTCAAFAHYPVNETRHHAVFNVPALPLKTGPTFFVYYNIDCTLCVCACAHESVRAAG